MSDTRLSARIGRRPAAAVLAVALALGASACSSSAKSSTPTTTAANGTTTTALSYTTVPKGYQAGAPTPDAALAAIRQYELTKGPPVGTWTITGVQLSSVDPAYVLFRVSPATGHEQEVQGGYGFAHDANATWTVTGFGSSEVGCPPGAPDNAVVPAPVIAGFALTCPPNAG